ncbi:MAG: sulfite exporter TauE/SafE family protein, partial [Gaiellaceae bacterium]
LGVTLLVCGIGFLLKAILHKRVEATDFKLAQSDKARAVTIGVIGGFIVGLTSVGSGTFFGLTMMLLFPLSAAQIVGTDIGHAAALLWVAGFGHIVAGNVDFAAMGWLLIGSIPGVLIGSHYTVRAGERFLRVALALVLFLSGVKLIDFPGANWVVVAVAGVALVAGLVAIVRRPRRPAPMEPTVEPPMAPII